MRFRGGRLPGTAEEFFSGKNPAGCRATPLIFALACAKNFQVYPAAGCHYAHIFRRGFVSKKVLKRIYPYWFCKGIYCGSLI